MHSALTLQVFSRSANLSLKFCAVFPRLSYPFSFQNFNVIIIIIIIIIIILNFIYTLHITF